MAAAFDVMILQYTLQRLSGGGTAGLFSFTALALLLAGTWSVLQAGIHKKAGSVWHWSLVLGWALQGAGTFAALETVLAHLVLRLHHASSTIDQPWTLDVGILLLGLFLIGAGTLLTGRYRHAFTGERGDTGIASGATDPGGSPEPRGLVRWPFTQLPWGMGQAVGRMRSATGIPMLGTDVAGRERVATDELMPAGRGMHTSSNGSSLAPVDAGSGESGGAVAPTASESEAGAPAIVGVGGSRTGGDERTIASAASSV
jgi:hypothetical protein